MMKLSMKIYKEDAAEADSPELLLWVSAFLAPFLMIINSFYLQKWSWGLMDDSCILASGSTLFERVCVWGRGLLNMGEFRPFSAIHAGSLYSIFESCPHWFYIFKAFEICFILFIWGFAAYRITKNILSIILVAVVTMSFHYFYDAFFYLSSSEIIGLLFLGVALNFFLAHIESFFNRDAKRGLLKLISGFLFLLCAFGSKEPFISSGVALGVVYLYLCANFFRKNGFFALLASGLILLFGSFCYGIFLLKIVKSKFTATYSFSLQKFLPNLNLWIKKDLFNHLPWVIVLFLLWFFVYFFRRKTQNSPSLKIKYAVLLGILFYLGYLFLLLPWNTTCQYAAVFGVFFAFIVALLLPGRIRQLNTKMRLFIIFCALVMNMFVAGYALNREATLQYDTKNLIKWFGANLDIFSKSDCLVYTNASEPMNAIPRFVGREFKVGIKHFYWAKDIDSVQSNKDCRYYLYSPRYTPVPISKLNNWEIIFSSKFWTLYRRR